MGLIHADLKITVVKIHLYQLFLIQNIFKENVLQNEIICGYQMNKAMHLFILNQYLNFVSLDTKFPLSEIYYTLHINLKLNISTNNLVIFYMTL